MPRVKRLPPKTPLAPVLAVLGSHRSLRPFSQSLPMSLLRAREAAMRKFRPVLRKFELTEQQWRVLRALSAVDHLEVTDLAHETCLLGPSLSRILQDLEPRKLISRKAHPDDLRRSIVSLAPAGVALIDAVTPFSETTYTLIAKRFGAEKLALLQSLLNEFEQAVEERPQTRKRQNEA